MIEFFVGMLVGCTIGAFIMAIVVGGKDDER